jgi:hypothetical protein
MEVFTAASLAALVVKFTSLIKYVSAADVRAAVTQVLTWVAGVVAVAIAAQADVSASLTVFGTQVLGDLDFWSQLLAGIALASAGSLTFDFRKAVDGTDSAKEPDLGTPGSGASGVR